MQKHDTTQLPRFAGGLLDQVHSTWVARGWDPALLASLRMQDGGDGGQGGEQKPPPGDEEGGEQKPPPAPPKVEFTPEQQAHIDDLIAKRTAKAKGSAEAEFKRWLEQQAMDEGDRLKAQLAESEQKITAAEAKVLTVLVGTAAERAALAAGVKDERLDVFLRNVDLTDLDELTADGKVDRAAVAAKVKAALDLVPEFKGSTTPPAGGASGADFNGGNGGSKQWTRAEVAALSTTEFEKHADEIRAQMRAGTLK